MTQQKPVLVVGSGPTGLIMAGRLAALDVPVRIIDRLEQPVSTSRAFTIHARTLELLAQIGLADTFLDHSLKVLSMDYHFPMKEDTPRLDFTKLDSVYPFCLTINQSDTEAILRDHLASLGVEIEWQTKLESFEQAEDSVTATLLHQDTGERETTEVEWLIGCDGFHSTVREQMNISLEGDVYAGTMRMMDVKVTGFPGTDEAIHYFIAQDHMLLFTKLPGEHHRVLISDKTEGVPPEQARAAFQEVLDQHFGGQVQLDEPVWSTNFRISRRQVSSYRLDRIFLAGDAAHINSPAGGQGMNVAMQDAFNLSWKLAMVIKGEAHEKLLDSYERERAPVASQMLEGTHYIHSIIMAHGKGMAERIALMQGGEWNRQAVNQVAGISYTYRPTDPDGEAPETTTQGITVGDRAPDRLLSKEQRLHDLVAVDGYTLLLFLGDSADPSQYDTLQQIARNTDESFTTKIAAHIIVPPAFPTQPDDPFSVVVDDQELHTLYNTTDTSTAYLLRPDCHIAYIGAAEDSQALVAWLQDTLHCLPRQAA